MNHFDLLLSQLADVFRIGLLMGLVYTTLKNRSQTGITVPILAGLVFVAVIIASTMPVEGITLWRSILSGMAANAVILAALWAIWSVYQRGSK